LKIYLDTSFLISLYSLDVNSGLAAQALQSTVGDYLLTTLGELEMTNALELRIFRKETSVAQARASGKIFEQDLHNGLFQLRPLTEQIFAGARHLSRQTTARLGTRTADLLHVAAAIELGAEYLYTFDRQQRALAQSLRIKLN
jgi:predicted nucleic acid-binding protein